MLEPNTNMLVALSLLGFQKLDALPIGVKKSGGQKIAVSGYSCLSEVLALGPGDYQEFLNEPCEAFSVKLATIGADEELEALLKTFSKTGFGFACVDGSTRHELAAFVGLRDLMSLYQKSLIKSDMSVGEVASSPIISLSKDVTIKRALSEMVERGIRRVFITGTETAVSARSIIHPIFSAANLSEASDKSYDLLGATLEDVEKVQPDAISAEFDLKSGSEMMTRSSDNCLVCEKGIVTPWDLIVKPWEQGKLTISA